MSVIVRTMVPIVAIPDEMILLREGVPTTLMSSRSEGVLDELDNILRRYKIVSVADFYEVVDQTPPFTAHRYGWTDLRQADIASGRDGYYIRMPKPAPLD